MDKSLNWVRRTAISWRARMLSTGDTIIEVDTRHSETLTATGNTESEAAASMIGLLKGRRRELRRTIRALRWRRLWLAVRWIFRRRR